MSEHRCPIPPNHREEWMITLERNADGTPKVWCDPCIVPLVRALNAGGVATIASCCGHGHRPGLIMLADGRSLIIAPDDEARHLIEALFPVDINGERRA